MAYFYKTMQSPVGELKLVATEKGLAAVLWENDDPHRVHIDQMVEQGGNAILNQAESQLREYFEGKRTNFTVPLDVQGTPFQKSVWDELLKIPFGETRTYGQLAAALGKDSAMRAVGAASGRNPLSIIAACHRVIGKDGSLTGFAGGLETKAKLLRHEGQTVREELVEAH